MTPGRRGSGERLQTIRCFQLELSQSGISIQKRNAIVTGTKFLFRVTLRRPDLVAEFYPIRDPKKIPSVMGPDEAGRRNGPPDRTKKLGQREKCLKCVLDFQSSIQG
jgi:hypothetical protein